MGCKSHMSFIYNSSPDLCKPGPPRSAQRPRPPPSKQPAAVGIARGRGGCRARARPAGIGAGTVSPRPRSAASHDSDPDPPPAGSRRALSRVAAAADGHWPMVHLQADGTAELRLQAAVAARGPSRRLPLLRRGHQAAEHRHPRAGRRRRPLSRPADRRHCRDGAALASPLSLPRCVMRAPALQ